MRKFIVALTLIAACNLIANLACNTAVNVNNDPNPTPTPTPGGQTDPTPNPGSETTPLNLVNTDIPTHSSARIEVGDDLIVYTYPTDAGSPEGVDYIIPSAGDTAGRGITNGDQYDYNSFAVCGKKIALVGDTTSDMAFQVAIFDTSTPTVDPVLIADADIRLGTIPVGNDDPGHIQADGNYIVTRNSSAPVVRVIDVSGDTPNIISFTAAPDGMNAFNTPQVLVDAETKKAIAVSTSEDSFYVFDIDNPDTAPVAFDVSEFGGISNSFQFACDLGIILYRDDTTDNNMYILDITDAANTPVALTTTEGYATQVFDDNYAYLSTEGPTSAVNASVIGDVDSADQTVAAEVTIMENSANLGLYGWGGTIAIAQYENDDNELAPIYFVAAPLQWSTGNGSWTVFDDPDNAGSYLDASHLKTNDDGSILGFRWGDDNTLGYVILQD